ncbi:MAG TPA: prepilin-type N-terminal cleavage/methylation domain-containing protein [Vicinamibacterales bacterium]|nr:prepilin-type N-terminal cleavage/methylation domain-containing protein [Vicinamibacterales bacterium]
MVSSVIPSPDRNQAGFTLIELLMAMAVSTAIMGSLVLVSAQMTRSYYSQLDGAAVQQEGRYALDLIVRTLQSAGNNPETIVTSPCPTAGTTFRAIQRNPNGAATQNNIRIHSDLNGNGVLGGATTGTCPDTYEDITFALNTTTQTITMDDNMIAGGAALDMTDTVITGLTFAYLDCARAATTDDDDVCYVQVTVTSQTPTVNNNTGVKTTYTNNAEVRMRTR